MTSDGSDPSVRDLVAADHRWVLALNADHVAETSALDAASLAALAARSRVALAIGEHAFLLALDEEAGYANANFSWFRERYPSFLYVDRLIVSPRARGQGLARRLYAALFARARDLGRARIACEVNEVPPNPASLALHAALGFAPVGEATLANGKRVRYLLRMEEPGAAS